MSSVRTIIFMGPQGSGKGTQRDIIKERLAEANTAVSIFQTGEMFRTLQKKQSFVAKKVKKTLDKGTHQPLALSVSLWGHVLVKYSDPQKHHLFDGLPRRLDEAKLLDEMLDFCERKPIDVIFLDVPDDEVIARMKARGRADDTDEGIAKRMDFYREYTEPILSYYEKHSDYALHCIDGARTPEEVTSSILSALNLT